MPIIVGVLLAVVSVIISVVMKNIAFVFYALIFVAGGFSYRFVPANRKFLATNRLLLGETREMTFYPHEIGSLDVLEDDADLTEEEREESTTYISTGNMHAYESKQGFLFTDGSITNGFLYVPKRGLDEEMIAQLRDFSTERCSSGYTTLAERIIEPAEEDVPEEEELDAPDADAICDAYYGANKLRIFDENGNRIRDLAATEVEEASEAVHDEISAADDAEIPESAAEEDKPNAT